MERRLSRALVLCILILTTILHPVQSWAADISPIIFTEVAAYEPEGLEWVEIYNQSETPVELTTWKFLEEGSKHSLRQVRGDGPLAPGAYAVIADNADTVLADHPESTVVVYDSSWGSLRTEGEPLALVASDGTTYEPFTYPANATGSVERPSPADSTWVAHTNGDTFGLPFSETVTNEMSTSTPVAKSSAVTIRASRPPTVGLPELPPTDVDRGVRITELFPDPSGPDAPKEFIELYNPSPSGVSVGGWMITNNAQNIHTIRANTFMPGMTRLLLRYDQTLLALDNTEDTISFIHPSGEAIDRVSYGDVVPGASYAYDHERRDWYWTVSTTPGLPNHFIVPNHTPVAHIDAVQKAHIGDQVFFDAHASSDPDDDTLSYAWDITGATSTAALTYHVFTEPGTYRIGLVVADSHNAMNTTWRDVIVEPVPAVSAVAHTAVVEKTTTPAKATMKTPATAPSTVTGTITALPGTFGSQIAYLQRPDGTGLQLYMNSKRFPSLHVGDSVSARGAFSHVRDEDRLKVRDTKDIQILSSPGTAEPGLVHIGELVKERYAQLLAIHGKVIDRQSTTAYIADDQHEATIDLHAAMVAKDALPLGDEATVRGILRPGTRGPVLAIRSAEDITVDTHTVVTTSTSTQTNTQFPWIRYAAIVSPILAMFLLYAIYRHGTPTPPVTAFQLPTAYTEESIEDLVESHPELRS